MSVVMGVAEFAFFILLLQQLSADLQLICPCVDVAHKIGIDDRGRGLLKSELTSRKKREGKGKEEK